MDELGARKGGSDRVGQVGPVHFFRGLLLHRKAMSVQVRGFRTGRTESDGSDEVGEEEDGFFFRRRGGHGAPGITVKRVAEPTLELSGPVSLPDGAGTAFYFLRGQHAAKLGRNGRVRAPVSIIDKKPPVLVHRRLRYIGRAYDRQNSMRFEERSGRSGESPVVWGSGVPLRRFSTIFLSRLNAADFSSSSMTESSFICSGVRIM